MKIKNLLLSWLMIILFLGNGALDMQAQTLINHAKQRQKENAEMQRVEKKNFEKACHDGTIYSYKEYLKMYPKGKYVLEINKLIADYDLWNNAKTANTIDAYKNYIEKSKYRSYLAQANEAILELQSISVWLQIKSGDDVKAVENFIREFPNSSCVSSANNRIHELQAVAFFKAGNYLKSYNEFNEAGGKTNIDFKNREIYDKCLEKYDFSKLNSSSTEKELHTFMGKYPNSEHFNDVSNMIALFKARRLDMFSGGLNMHTGESEFSEALSYVKDEKTLAIVQGYINNCKKSYLAHKKQLKKSKIKANGGYVNFGIEILDIGWNGISPDRYLDVGFYNIGASVRFGNYKSPVQLELGIKPGVILWNLIDEDSFGDYEVETEFHIPVYAKLKINILSPSDYSKFYIGGLFMYNAIREEYLENEFSIGGGVGTAWRHWDWMILYYKQDLENIYGNDDKFIGTSVTYYF